LVTFFLVEKDDNAFKFERVMSGYTGVYVALKMAYYIGFDTVLVFGVDHNAGWEHCADNYPKGVPSTESKKAEMRWHFAYANDVYRSSGRRILNFSLPSKLDRIFDRGDLAQWLDYES